MRSNNEPQLGAEHDYAAIPLTSDEQTALAELFVSWKHFSEDALPPISPLAPRLFTLDVDAPNASGELISIIESDPMLTARILALANSIAFAGAGKPVFDMKAALFRLGLKAAVEAAFSQLMVLWFYHGSQLPDPEQLHTLWIEYLITGVCAREIATTLRDEEITPSLAYSAGLLHDVGTLALSHVEPRLMSRFIQADYGRGSALYASFVEAHCELGSALLREWHAPRELSEAAAGHHMGLDTSESATTMVVFVADHLHQAVVDQAQGQLHLAHDIGCFGGATEEVTSALASLGMTDKMTGIVAAVAAESGRIEALASIAVA